MTGQVIGWGYSIGKRIQALAERDPVCKGRVAPIREY